MKMNERVAQWAKTNFSLSKPKSADLSAQIKQLGSEMLASVHEGSPAFFLGIKAGWILVSINGKAYDRTVLISKKLSSKVIGQNRYEFYDPRAKQRRVLKSKFWPFGITLIQPPSKIADALLNGGAVSWTDIQTIWRLGLIPEMGELYPALEAFCADAANRTRPTHLPPENEPLPLGVHVDATAALSLAAFAAGHIDRAAYIYKMTEARLKKSGSISSYTLAMHYYVGSILSDLNGNHEDAVKYARRAYKRTPDVPEVQKNLQTLTGETHAPVTSEFEQTRALNYELPNIDPVGEIPSTGAVVSFEKTLKHLGANQLLLVFVMGHYRSNSYYTDDLLAAAPIFKAFKDKVKTIHVICESDYTLHPDDRQRFEKLAIVYKMPLVILFDKDKTVSPLLNANGYPCRLFYNKSGEVLSEEKLWDETGIWEAFRKS